MEIKTITCHDVYNAGARLQAYALMTYLNSLGHHTQIIDFKPDYLTRGYALWTRHHKLNFFPANIAYGLFRLPGKLAFRWSRRKGLYDDFSRMHMSITEKEYRTNEELKINPPLADLYFAGSDQIWNPLFPNGKEPAFYLDFAPESAIKASYAASFAGDALSEDVKALMAGYISQLDMISVRESTGIDILKDLGIERGVHVMDPVFLLSKEHWLSLAEQSKQTTDKQEKYLLVYDFENSIQMSQLARKIAKERSLKIYSFFSNDYCDKSLYQSGPLEFMLYINSAELVLSNSFHGTAFSIILEKDFLVLRRKENLNARMTDLLSAMELTHRLIDTEVDEGIATKPIDYTEVNDKSRLYVEQSKYYIQDVIQCTIDKNGYI